MYRFLGRLAEARAGPQHAYPGLGGAVDQHVVGLHRFVGVDGFTPSLDLEQFEVGRAGDTQGAGGASDRVGATGDRNLRSPLQFSFLVLGGAAQHPGCEQEQHRPADEGDRDGDGHEAEHGELDTGRVGDAGDEQVGAGADQRGRAGQRGGVRDGQQHAAGGHSGLAFEFLGSGDEHRDDRGGVDQRRGDADRWDEAGQGLSGGGDSVEQAVGDAGDDAGVEHALGDDEHGGDGDDAAVGQPGEQLGRGGDAGQPGDDQGADQRQYRGLAAGGHDDQRHNDDHRGQDGHGETVAGTWNSDRFGNAAND